MSVYHNASWSREAQIRFAGTPKPSERNGVLTYTILPSSCTNQLFGYVELKMEERWNAIAQTEICRNGGPHEGNHAFKSDKAQSRRISENFHHSKK